MSQVNPIDIIPRLLGTVIKFILGIIGIAVARCIKLAGNLISLIGEELENLNIRWKK